MVNTRYFCSKPKGKLDPWFITGFTDGEGSFSVRIRKKSNSALGFHVSIVYSIGAEVNPLNLKLLEKVREYFDGVGSISKSANMYYYEVSSIKSLINIRKHFENFPLQTTKYINFKLWCQIFDIIAEKAHLTKPGFYKVLSLKILFPKGLSSDLLEIYSKNIVHIVKPVFEASNLKLNPNWIAGFVQADGTFGLNFTKQERMKLGYTCQPQFRITQHERDLIVLNRIIESIGCGTLVKPSGDRDRYNISVANISELVDIILPLFQNNPLYGAKGADFLDFSKGISIIRDKGHLTPEGLKKLKDLSYAMNTYRKF